MKENYTTPDSALPAGLSGDNRGALSPEWKFFHFCLLLWFVWGACSRLFLLNTFMIRTAMTCATGAIAIAYLLNHQRDRFPRLYRTTVPIVLLAAISVVYANNLPYAAQRCCSMIFMIAWSSWFLPQLLHSGKLKIQTVFKLMLLYSTIVMVLIFYLGGDPLPSLFGSTRFDCGFSLTATGVADTAALALPFFFYAAKYGKNLFARLFWLLFITGTLIFLFASKGRTGICSFLFLSPLLVMLYFNAKVFKTIFLMFLAAGLIFICIPQEWWSATLRLESNDLTTGRAILWEITMREAWTNPILGHGIGENRDYLIGTMISGENEINPNTHNQFATIFFDWGIVGIVIWSSYMFSIISLGLKLIFAPRKADTDFYLVFYFCFLFNVLNCIGRDGLDSSGNISSYFFWLQGGVIIVGAHKLLPSMKNPKNTTSVSHVH